MKTIAAVLAEVDRHLTNGWHLDVTGTAEGRWPKQVSLGTVSSAAADTRYREVLVWSHGWHDWARNHDEDARLLVESRRIRGIAETLPSHLLLADVDRAVRIVGNGWPQRMAAARRRAELLRRDFSEVDAASVLKGAASLDDVDFAIACTAGRWFADNPDVWPGLTPRQVPIEGLHGKWLNKHRALVQILAGLDGLTLAERPTRIHWTYLDPAHLAAGGRRHDSLTLGDTVALPYRPSVVVIVENKDTAVFFPEVPGGICVEGNGNAAPGLLSQVNWITNALSVVYWGDMDAAGYEIVDRLRASLPHLRSILMDLDTFEQYERYGTNVDERGAPLKLRPAKPCPNLTDAERTVYDRAIDPHWTGHRRIEQERIPLVLAAAAIERVSNYKTR